MKKRNIVRFTAFIMAMLMCTSSAVTLFAEGVDSTEESVIEATESVTTEATESPSEESASEAITEDETETQTVSGNETTPTKPTRSELGQKILEFKNSDEYKDKKLFGTAGLVGKFTEDNDFVFTDEIAFSSVENQYTFGELQSLGTVDGIYGIYNSETDSCLQFRAASDDNSDYAILSDDTSKKTLSSFYHGTVSTDAESFKQSIDSLYIYIADNNNDLLFVCKYVDYPKYVEFSLPSMIQDNSTATITTSSEDNISVDCNITYNIQTDGYIYDSTLADTIFNGIDVKDRCDKLVWVKIYSKADGRFILSYTLDSAQKDGNLNLKLENVENGDYICYFGTLVGRSFSVDFNISCLKPEDDSDTIISDEDLKAVIVSFSGMPDEAYTNDSVILKMNTDKKCKMSFNGASLANNEYATSADFTVTRNGTYSYTAINEQGVATNGTFEVTFFKEKVTDAINDPLQSDLVSAKTDTTLSQTGLYQTWLIILAVILCSFGILLIANQKYHFLDKFVRRFKHESN